MKNLKRLALGVAVVLAIVVGLATPAQAYWGCPAGTACVFTGPSGTGLKLVISFSGAGGPLVCHNLPASAPLHNFDNNVTSVTEDYGSFYDLILYPAPDCNNDIAHSLIWLSPTNTGAWNFGSGGYVAYDNIETSYLIGNANNG